jgi:hypothetical protein
MKYDDTVSIRLTTRGLVVTAQLLHENGLFGHKTLSRLNWLEQSGADIDHPEVKKYGKKS